MVKDDTVYTWRGLHQTRDQIMRRAEDMSAQTRVLWMDSDCIALFKVEPAFTSAESICDAMNPTLWARARVKIVYQEVWIQRVNHKIG